MLLCNYLCINASLCPVNNISPPPSDKSLWMEFTCFVYLLYKVMLTGFLNAEYLYLFLFSCRVAAELHPLAEEFIFPFTRLFLNATKQKLRFGAEWGEGKTPQPWSSPPRCCMLRLLACSQRSAKVQEGINDCYFEGVRGKPCSFLRWVDGFTAVAEFW